VIKKFKVELFLLVFLLFIFLFPKDLDNSLYFYFKNLDQNPDTVYFKDFFNDITILGDSFWYFIFCIFGIIIFIIFEKTKLKNFNNIKEPKILFLYTIICLLITGIITQAIKHVIGRARPNYTHLDGSSAFDFFTINSNFHSFPSGHSSTIFILALIFSSILPRLKYCFLGFAFLVALSRIVVGAHFLSDIIGGMFVALISFKFLNLFLEYNFIHLKPKKIKNINQNSFFSILFVLFLLTILLTIGPSFDLFFSSLFYKGNNQFFLQSISPITIFIRDILLPIILIYILILPIVSRFIPIKKLFFGYNFTLKDIIFIWLVLFINLVIVVNLILKIFWGRARPGDVVQLGGNDNFSAWYQISDACTFNCSFVSGDAAVGFSLIILYFITNNLKYTYLSIFFGSILGFVRIAEGGHFLSDVIFSAIIIFLISFLINKIFFKKLL